MTDNVSQAARRPGAVPHLVRSQSAYAHTKGVLNLRQAALTTRHRTTDVSTHNSSTQPTEGLSSGGYSDVTLRSTGFIQDIVLKLELSNESAGALSVQGRDSLFIIEHIDVLASGSDLLERIDAEHLWLAFGRLPAAQQAALSWGLSGGASSDPDADYNISAGSSTTVYVPLLSAFLSDHQFAVESTSQPITLRVYFRGNGAWTGISNVLAAQPKIASFAAIVRSYTDPHESQLARARYSGPVPMHIRIARPGLQKTSESLSSGRMSVRLSGVTGLVTSMSVAVRAIGETRWTAPLVDVDILHNGSSIWGSALPAVYLQSSENAHEGANANTFTSPGAEYRVLSLPIGSSGTRKGEARGALLGYRAFDGTSYELIINGPVLADVEVCVIYRTTSVLAIQNGRIQVQNS
jgi:hypothetical protein